MFIINKKAQLTQR